MKKILFLFILIQSVGAETISFVDFENRAEGAYTNALAKEDFKRNSTDNSWWYSMEANNGENAKIIDAGDSHGKVLQLKYPKGCIGTGGNAEQGLPPCAGQIVQPLEKFADTLWLSYDIFIEEGFEFRLGGKLPGLCGGKCYTGYAMPDTGDGWSARIMWREDGDIVQLLYFMGQEFEYGDDSPWNLGGQIPQKRFSIGKWHNLVTKVSMNTLSTWGIGDKNGRIQSWLDGELVMDVDTLRLRDFDTLHVDKFYLSTFHGGSTIDWAPTHDCFIRFDNFLVTTDSIPVKISESAPELVSLQKSSQNFSTAIFHEALAAGKSFALKSPLEKETSIAVYRLDGSLAQKKTYPKGTQSISLPTQNSVYLVKILQKN